MQNRRRRAIALISTLMIMVMLISLVGAFVTVNAASSKLAGNSVQRRRAQDACLTAMSVAWARLENDKAWGTSGHFAATAQELYPNPNPRFRVQQRLSVSGRPILVGDLDDEGDFDSSAAGHFELQVYNNLTRRNKEIIENMPVPARSVRLVCTARCGTTTRKLDTILRQQPLSYESMAAGNNIRVNANLLRLESRDPYINRIRAEHNMELPSDTAVRFLGHGDAMSKDALRVGGTDLASQSEERVLQANDRTGGTFVVGKDSGDTPGFDMERVKLPETKTQAAAGTYTFGGITYVEYVPHQITFPEGLPGQTGSCTRYQRVASVYDRLRTPDGRLLTADVPKPNETVVDPPYDPPNSTDSRGDAEDYGMGSPGADEGWEGGVTPTDQKRVHQVFPGLWANVQTGQMAIESGYTIESSGEFLVAAEGSRAPEMLFGYKFTPQGVAEQQSLRNGSEAAQDHPETYMAALIAQNSIDIPGGALGYGSMVSTGGDIVLKASSGLRAAPELGVVVKARNLTIKPATEPEPSIPGEPVPTDYGIFRDAINSYVAGHGASWEPFDDWLKQTTPARDATIEQFRSTPVGSNVASYWSQLNTALGKSYPLPDEVSSWPTPPTIEQYVRLKEFIQTRASFVNHGDGDTGWLSLSEYQVDADQRLENTIGVMCQWAKSYKKSLQEYLASADAEVPEMFYQGLLFADQNLVVNAEGKSFRLEGSMVSGNDALINNANKIDLVYDRGLVDDQLKTNLSGNHIRLEKIYFTMH